MSKAPTGAVKVDDYFHMDALTVMSTWGLSEEELRREFFSGRLVAHGHRRADGGYEDLCFFLPSLLRWIGRKRFMPKPVRTKVEIAGGFERLDQFRREQINLCQLDLLHNTITLPDGSVMRDIMVKETPRH
jgi:hypothetical protein